MNTIQNKWEIFSKAVFPKDASVIQISEMQKAFYAGAISVASIMIEVGASNVSLDWWLSNFPRSA